MLMRFARWRACCLAVTVILTVLAGCSKKEAAKSDTQAKPEVKAEPAKANAAENDTEIQANVEAKLAEADELDGTIDKIVQRCASCALGMDGKSEHALEVSGYTLYFCSGPCKEGFAKDPTKSILDLEIPED